MNDRIHRFAAPLAVDDLLGQYQAGSSFFASSSQAMLAQGVRASLPACASNRLAAAAASLLADACRDGVRAPRLIGAVPFRPDAPARLILPEHTLLTARGDMLPATAAAVNTVASRTAMAPAPQRYRDNVASALAAIAKGRFDKVVLSRSLTLQARIDVQALLRQLYQANTQAYRFAVALDDGRSLLGASPELLLARRGRMVSSRPLAGSIARSSDPQEDQRRAAALLRSAKDRREHALVVDAVAEALRPFCRSLQVPAEPELHATPTMWHLASAVHGELADPAHSSLALALALHPTPAVCGHPTEAAQDFIAEVEGFDRGYFTGLVGWCDAEGDGEWAVTIRCAELGLDSATLYAGAGIVAGSEPALELAETSAKLRTMLLAMGLDVDVDTEAA
ncbi:isochorismate synthase MenF [Chitinimonas sp.]|uniref:isochorismate synthase n=1 Tax=Chitinimonas sp. TaxID=1934313 RepID=UPI0035B4A832